jgi:hypothetical protein
VSYIDENDLYKYNKNITKKGKRLFFSERYDKLFIVYFPTDQGKTLRIKIGTVLKKINMTGIIFDKT